MSCEPITCEKDELFIGFCTQKVVFNLSENDKDEFITLRVSTSNEITYFKSKVGCGGILEFDVNFMNFIQIGQIVELKLFIGETANTWGVSYPFPFGDSCKMVCGIKLEFTDKCLGKVLYINANCASKHEKIFELPIYNCLIELPIRNCTFFIKVNTNKMNITYRNKRYLIEENPILDGEINPKFIEELNMIENGVFTVSINSESNTLEISYMGIYDVTIENECGEQFTKTCF